jgi:hypothetical protein
MNLSYYLAHNRFLKKVINNHYKLNLPMGLLNFSPPFFEFLIALALFLFQAFSALSMLIHLISIFLFPFFLFPFITSLVIFFLPKVFQFPFFIEDAKAFHLLHPLRHRRIPQQ